MTTTVATDYDNIEIQQQYSDVNNRWDVDDWDNENSSARLFERSRIKALAGRSPSRLSSRPGMPYRSLWNQSLCCPRTIDSYLLEHVIREASWPFQEMASPLFGEWLVSRPEWFRAQGVCIVLQKELPCVCQIVLFLAHLTFQKYWIVLYLRHKNTVDPGTTWGLGTLICCTFANPHLTFDSPRT